MLELRSRLTAAACAAAFAATLGGCQMLGIGGRAGERVQAAGSHTEFGAELLAQGRLALVEGRTADAIDSFFLARSFPEHAPAAMNGLAVAYSRIGRSDLAERFFRSAVALAPQDDRYRNNLRVFYARSAKPEPVLAMPSPAQPSLLMPQRTTVAPAIASPAVRSLGAGITAQAAPATMQRVSLREVRIGTAPAARVAHRPVIHVGRNAPAPDYPIRISLAEVGKADGSARQGD